MNKNIIESRIPGFYNLSPGDRLPELKKHSNLSDQELAVLSCESGLTISQADHMIENVVGRFSLPLGIALNFLVNGREVLVPMAIEEPSVVAGASYMAKLARSGGGFTASSTAPEMIGQLQVLDVADLAAGRLAIIEHKDELLAEAAEIDPVLKRLGGGPRDVQVRLIED